jgi:hypothetical protein
MQDSLDGFQFLSAQILKNGCSFKKGVNAELLLVLFPEYI